MIASLSRFRVWLFDFDNTLAALEREVDWPGGRRKLEAFLRAELAARGLDDAIFSEIPRGNLPLYAALHARWLRDGASPGLTDAAALLAAASAIIETIELDGVARAAPLPGAPELLRRLAGDGRTIAIVTSNSSRTVARWLECYRLAATVATIVGRDSALALKPSPEMIYRALELCGAPPEDAIFVGDSEADYRAASAVGVRFLAIHPDQSRDGWLAALDSADIFASPGAIAAEFDEDSAFGRRHPDKR
jgi:HAD superfamily hydrolase (TIGR01509 family)